MSEPIKLVAFCGALRKASFNRMALTAFAERLPAGCTMQMIEIGDWPMYDADIQAKGFPAPVQAAQQAILAADGIVFATPEYNYSISGVLKNAIDWLSRTTPQPFAAKPVGIMGATMGMLGTASSPTRARANCWPTSAPRWRWRPATPRPSPTSSSGFRPHVLWPHAHGHQARRQAA
jgi:chromate reductase